MIGSTIAHYKILSKLGSGGMGVVYKAEDTKLERKVALKFLPSHYTADEKANKRFKREARAAAKLNHPNIVTIHEIGEHDAPNGGIQTYIAMEHVDGKSLRDVMEEGEIAVDRVTDIATQICEGLSEAHKAGITHRDIKPENILIDNSGRVKLLDFGLAQMIGMTRLTIETSTVGTAKYMSPEQYKAADIDHRTDIWSFGVVLFEMLTGKIPFQGEYEAAVMYSVVNTEPEKATSVRPNIPKYFDNIIKMCLVKDPAKRYQNVLEILKELKAPSPLTILEPGPNTERSIVVLPFENMSSDPEQEYFSDGLTEEIITDLSHIHDLRVISRNSAMMLKGSRKETKTIAKELNVQYVLEGSVRKAGNNLRITAQLINAPADDHVWAEKYDGILDDIFDIQEKVSRSIVDALKVKLTHKESKQIAERPIDNVEAYEYYHHAKREIYRGTEEGLKRAIQDLQLGLEIVGENALLNKGMAEVYLHYYEYGVKADEETLLNVEKYANMFMVDQPDSDDSYYLLGRIERFRGSTSKAAQYFEKAYAINPENTDVLLFLGNAYGIHVGNTSLADQMCKKLLELDPLTPLNYCVLGIFQMYAGQLEDALSALHKFAKLAQDDLIANLFRVYIYAWKNQYDKTNVLVDQMVNQKSLSRTHDIFAEWCLFFKYALKGDKTKALKTISEDTETYIWNDPELMWLGVCNYALIDEKEEAFKWLEHIIDKGFINYPFLSEHAPFLENIRSEPRFKKLMERVKHEWENFGVENAPPFIEEEETELSESQEKSIIVLPFDDMSPDKDNEYFSDGLTEEIITDLSHIHDLLVISRSSAMTFKGKDKKIKEIAREVNVQYVLEGSVRKAGNNLRITAQLIDATTDAHLWAEKYSGTLDDVFYIQEKVSRSIVDALKVKLTAKEDDNLAERSIENAQAYDCYLKARHGIYLCTEEGLNRALQDLKLGLEIVGDNVLLYKGMAEVYLQYYEYGFNAVEETLLNVEKYAKKV
ncbi:protein kinase, partial [candidate division KSB1 bacterium]